MGGFTKGVSAAFSARGLGGLLVVIAVLVALELVGYGPAAIAGRIRGA